MTINIATNDARRYKEMDQLQPRSYNSPFESIGLCKVNSELISKIIETNLKNVEASKQILYDHKDKFYTLPEWRKGTIPFLAFKPKVKKQDGIRDGQIIWVSVKPISKKHIEKIIKIAAINNQSVHINTGTHGDKKGNTVETEPILSENKFHFEDFYTAYKADDVSVYKLACEYGPKYPQKANQVINAWCFSILKKDVIKEYKIIDNYFPVFKKPKDFNPIFLEMASLKNDITSDWVLI